MASYLLRFVLALFMFPILSIQLEDALVNIPPQYVHRMQVAVEDCVALATLVSVVFDDCDPVFQRYFPKSDAAFVKQVFRRVANIAPDAVLTPNDYVTIMQQRATIGWDPRFVNLIITYDNHPQGMDQWCGGADDPDAFFTRLYSGSPCICICPTGLRRYPDFSEIFNPPDWARDAAGNPIPGYGCDGLGDHDSDLMWFPGAVLLHELMHYPQFLDDIPQYNDLINLDGATRAIEDYPGPNPPNGYGPFYARVLQYLSTVNPEEYGQHEAVNNADNYVAYALSVWWRWRCQKEFKESVTVQDTWNRNPPPRPPP